MPEALIKSKHDNLPHRSTVCFSFLESCGGTILRSEGPLGPTRLADDELRVPAVTVLNVEKENGKTDKLGNRWKIWRLRER